MNFLIVSECVVAENYNKEFMLKITSTSTFHGEPYRRTYTMTDIDSSQYVQATSRNSMWNMCKNKVRLLHSSAPDFILLTNK